MIPSWCIVSSNRIGLEVRFRICLLVKAKSGLTRDRWLRSYLLRCLRQKIFVKLLHKEHCSMIYIHTH